MLKNKDKAIEIVKAIAPELEIYEHREQTSFIINKENLLKVCMELKNNPDTKFDMLLDVTAIDWLKDHNRFEVVYFLYSNEHKSRLRIKVAVDIHKCEVPSVVSIWESANWYERESYDMYGIKFAGHPGLRRFYMPEDFADPISGEQLYPLRKDFPLMGVPDSLPLPPYPEKYGEVL